MRRENVKPYEFLSENERGFLTARKQDFFTRLGASASKAEFRSSLSQFDLWNAMFPSMFDGIGSGSGTLPSVSVKSAQRIATVFSCLNVRGETVGSLPFSSKKNTDTGAVVDYKTSVHRLLHDRPSPNITAFDFWSTIEKLKLAWGNSYAEIIRDRSFNPIELKLLPSWDVEFKQLPNSTELYYSYKGRTIRSTDVLHFKNYSEDGLCGLSSIKMNQLTMGRSLKLSQYNNNIIGERPPGYLTSEKKPKDLNQKAQMRSQWDKRTSLQDEQDPEQAKPLAIGGIPFLTGGLEYKQFSLPADDVAYIEAAKLTDQDITAIFRIPPVFVQNYENAPYNSSEQQDIIFAKYTLASTRAIEQECTEKLYPESNKVTYERFAKFSLQGLLSGDHNTRKEFYASGIQNGWLTPNQACAFEDLPTYGPDGDKHYMQGAMVPVDKLADFVMSKSAGTGQTREQILGELKRELKTKMNGHYQEVEPFLN
jgi:HK97 family phage portal protein